MTDDFEQQLGNLTAEEQKILSLLLAENELSDGPRAIPAENDPSMTFPLSFAQQRMWFLNQVDPQSAVYNIPAAYRLNGPLDIAALEQSLRTLVERHAALRTVFALEDSEPRQVICEDPRFVLSVTHLPHLPPEERESAVLEQLFAEGRKPFDLSRDLMIRALLLAVGTEEHILSIVIHHIASDGWSMAIFRRELAELYAAYSSGTVPKLAELPIRYTDYAVWQRKWLQGQRLEQQLAYWRKQLDGISPIQLPADRRRPKLQSYQGDSYRVELPESLLRPLRALAQQAGATLFMTLLAAFGTLLQRSSGQEDIVIGTVVANRRRAEMEGLIGFFLNTLALRIDLSGDPAFSELLARVRHTALDAFENQDMPFEKLLEELQPERELNRMPIVQVLLVLQNMPSAYAALAGVEIQELRIDHHLSKLDLSLYLTETDHGLRAHFEYSTDLFDSSTIERMASHFQALLESIVADPDRPIGQLTMIPAAERSLVLDTWNQTDVPFNELSDLVSRFYGQAAAQPDQTAFQKGADNLTYDALNRRSNQLAHYLLAQGIEPGTRIGVCLERSLDVPIALLAIFKLGGVYVPLDPSYPAERLRLMAEDAGVTAVISASPWLELLGPLENQQQERRVFCLDTLTDALSRQSSEDLQPDVRPDDLAYIIYTSGSTGRPKGAAVAHRQILNRLAWMWNRYPFEPDEIGCQKTSLNFVDSLWELLGYLLQGVPTVIIGDDVIRDPQLLVDALAAYNVTRLWLVPSLLRAVLDTQTDLQRRLPNLRFWVSSGEPLSTALYRQFAEVMPKATLYNLYGTSEIWDATWFDPQEPGVRWQGPTVPIGRPIDNMRTVILDANGQPVPIGVTGELCVGGMGLAEGYVNQPELTDEKFGAPPWLSYAAHLAQEKETSWRRSDRIYHTGDLARRLPDGNIEYMGRADRQVKLRGHRIELEEIETLLDRHPAIRQSVIAVEDHDKSTARLVAYCVPRAGATPTAADLYSFLQGHLPSSMIPSSFLLLYSLPLTPSGKIDRTLLAGIESTAAALTGEQIAPRTPTEEALAGIWKHTLNRDAISVHDNFFASGGHSLLGIQLFARIEQQFGRRLPIALLFSAPTIAELAVHLDQVGATEPGSELVVIREDGQLAPFFCVHGFGGGVLGYADLARQLGPDQPFYGLQAAGLNGEQQADESIEKMAARYIAAMRQVRPSGPYHLGGYCFGGVVAFEMARQLEAAGEAVPMVAIMEGYAPMRYQRRASLLSLRRWYTIWQNIPYWLEDYWSIGYRGLRLRIQHRGRIWAKGLSRNGALEAQDLLPDDLSVLPEHHRQLMERHLLALRNYEPTPIEGRITLFVARGKTINTAVFGSADPEHGWGALAEGGVQVELVDGGHRNIHLWPHVTSLAAALKKQLLLLDSASIN